MSNFVSNENMTTLMTGIGTKLDDKVAKVDGKGLSTEDYTSAEKSKLAGVAANAQVNTIESISVNGDAVTPDANKNVALTVITKAVNDLANYYLKTETYTKTEVDNLISAISTIQFEVVAELPTTNIKTNVIYLVPKSTAQTSNVKDEYINLDGTTAGWEKIGDTAIDLSGYVTTTALNTALADYTTTADLTTLLGGYIAKSQTAGLMKNDGSVDTNTYAPQFTTMPTASATYAGKTVQYVGATDANYTSGVFYKCVESSGSYSWVAQAVSGDPAELTTAQVNALLALLD